MYLGVSYVCQICFSPEEEGWGLRPRFVVLVEQGPRRQVTIVKIIFTSKAGSNPIKENLSKKHKLVLNFLTVFYLNSDQNNTVI